MKKYIFPLLLLTLGSCVQEGAEPIEKQNPENMLQVTLKADLKPVTKVTFDDGGQLVWEDQDSVALLIGDDSCRGSRPDNSSLVGLLTSVDDGVFEGIVDLGAFNRDDIQGAIYPYSDAHHFRIYENEGVKYNCLGMLVGGKMTEDGDFLQIQKKDNVLHGGNVTLFSRFTPDYTKDHPNNNFEYGGKYLLDDKVFDWGSALIRFNIYGKHAVMDESEVLTSVVLAPKMAGLAGVHYYVEGNDGFMTMADAVSTTDRNTVTVTLEEGVSLADKTQENGVKVFMSLLPKGNVTFPEGAEVTVYTDKWFYYVPLSGISVNLECGKVRKVALDMSSAVSPEKTYYSADGGEWTMALPETFQSLAVKGGIRADMLENIRDAVWAQKSAVDLDMSQAVYEAVEFPALFTATAGAPDQTLKSISFPSNVTKIAANAFLYCKALESVDLSTVSEIGGSAFRYAGLKTLNIPSNVSMIGNYAFGDLQYLQTVYYNPSIDWAAVADAKGTYSRHIPNRNNVSEWNERSNPLSVTIGPDVTELPEYCFDTNAKLTELIIEGDNLRFIYQWGIRAYNIERIEFKGGLPSEESSGPGGDFAKKLDEYEGTIFVPDGKLAEFADNAAVQTFLATGKYMIREVGSEGQASKALYSVEGEHWYETLPATFDKLYVKTEGENEITISELYMIKTAMKQQSQPVDIDFSQATYMSQTFPAMFNGTGSADPATYIKSIRFPKNVTDIASHAFQYCESLESVDLTGIQSVGEYAFHLSGLKTVNVPSSVTSVGQWAFSHLKYATEIYYNAPVTTAQKVLGNRNNGADEWNSAANPLKVTFGPAVTALGDYMFDTNGRLTELVFESENFFVGGNNWLIRVNNLKRIEFKAGPPDTDAKTPAPAGYDFAANLAVGEGVIICPDGMYDQFNTNPNIQNILSSGKYIIKEHGEANPMALYSVDGQQWSESIPETFSKLYVSNKPEGTVTATDVVKIAAAVNEQASLVEVDMSAAVFKSDEFPAYFRDMTNLKAISFPPNITAVAANAFSGCTKLESVDLSKITRYGASAFKLTGLRSVRLENTVTSLGQDVFRCCYNLGEAYFNVPASSYAGVNDPGVFRWNNPANMEKQVDLVLTIGPDATLPRYGVSDNRNLVKIIFEYTGEADCMTGNNAFNRVMNLRTVICKGTTGLMYGSVSNTAGSEVDASVTKYLVVPDGCSDLYKNHSQTNSFYKQIVNNCGFQLIEQSDYIE